jgi:hypothetical protein
MFTATLDLNARPTRMSRTPWDDLSAIERRFPRIARELCSLWGQEEVDRYLDSLLIDERGDRQGFPSAVLEELMFLSSMRWQTRNPEYVRADEGLAEYYTFNPDARLDDRYCTPVKAWVLS